MSIETVAKRSDALFQYVVPVKTSTSPVGIGEVSGEKLFTTAMFASPSLKTSPVDLWGNVKIPKIEHYENSTEPDSNGWFETRLSDDYLAVYSSFVGVPIDGAQDKTGTTDYEFDLQTEYLQSDCASVDWEPTIQFPYGELPPDAYNITGHSGIIWWSEAANRSKIALEILKPFNFSYNTRQANGVSGSISCSMKSSYVEVGVLCAVNATCRAVKVRRSRLPQLAPAFTCMDLGRAVSSFMESFMRIIGRSPSDWYPDLLNTYLEDPSLRVETDLYSSITNGTNATQIPNEALSDRFGQLLNSYWASIYSTYTITGGINANTSYFWDKNITFVPPKIDLDSPDSPENYNWTFEPRGTYKSKVWLSKGNKYEHIEIMKAHKPWAITLSIASLVLITFSLVPPLVRHFLTNSPDIAMNFSSLATRNNAHVPIPAGGSFLPAADRFRLLKGLRLRFADAEGKSDVGNLVIAAQGVGNLQYSKVRKERLYE